jgi:hypothetical protein
MTSHANSRYGFMFALVIAVTAAVAVAGSVWAKGNGQQNATTSEGIRIDVSALHASAEIANLPLLHIEDPM